MVAKALPTGYTEQQRRGTSPTSARGAEIRHEAGEAKGLALRAFNKFNNDWTMNLVSMVSYNVLTSFIPLLLAIITLLAFIPSITGSNAHVAAQINQILPPEVRKNINIADMLSTVQSGTGLLSLISIAGLLWGGSNLFGTLESAFAIVFRVKTRDFLAQKLMCVVMILLFVVLLPLSFASSALLNVANTTLGQIVPSAFGGAFAIVVALATSLASLFVLFMAIYVVVPNIPVAWRYAWRGALVAAIAMWIVNTFFGFYTAHFVGTKQYGAAGLGIGIILITWFWLFSLVLLIGAQVNALVMGIGAWKYDLTRVLMEQQIPVTSGATTAVEALRGKQDADLKEGPFGLARDSQNVEDPAKAFGPASDAKKDTSGGKKDKATASASGHNSKQASREPSVQPARQVRQAAASKPAGGKQSSSSKDQPHAAHEMDPSLIATSIEAGGVRMEEPLGPISAGPDARRGFILIGATVGVASTVLTLLRHGDSDQ